MKSENDAGSAGILIVNKDGLVLGVPRRDNPNDYGICGGKRESNETALECAVRECFEEANVIVDPEKCFLIYCDKARKSICATYLLFNQEVVPGMGDCGMSKWVTWEQLESGTFGEYNKQLHVCYDKFLCGSVK